MSRHVVFGVGQVGSQVVTQLVEAGEDVVVGVNKFETTEPNPRTADLDTALSALLDPSLLKGAAEAATLLADAIDFLGDAANYGVSLWVLAMALTWRARAALLKGASMLAFGVFVIGRVAWGAWQGVPPEPLTMGSGGLLALAANLGVAVLLYAWREGDANMRGVWLCTRNDALAGRDDSRRLLPAQHRSRDLGGVRQVAEPRLHHLHARAGQPVLKLGLQVLRDVVRVAPQRQGIVIRVVRIRGRQMPHGGLALHVHVLLVPVNLEHSLERIVHAPDDDRRDLDRVSRKVVHLQLLAIQSARPERYRPAHHERVPPVKPRLLDRPLVAAEEQNHFAAFRRDDEEPDGDQHRRDQQQDVQRDQIPQRQLCSQRTLPRHPVEQPAGRNKQNDVKNQQRPTRIRPGFNFTRHSALLNIVVIL